MLKRILVLCGLALLPVTAHAQSLSENGWTALYNASTEITTSISSSSNNVSLPRGTINVLTTEGFVGAGTIIITLSTGSDQTVTCTGKTSTTFTGCTGGSGTMTTGAIVRQTGNGQTGAVTIDNAGTAYWGSSAGQTSDNMQLPLRRRTPTGPGTGRSETLHYTGQVAGLAFIGTQLYFGTYQTRAIQRFVPGQYATTWVLDPVPGNGTDNPAGMAVVPTGWPAGNSIVSAGDLILPDSDTPDVLVRITPAGAATVIGTDPANAQTFVNVAASKARILVSDRENGNIWTVSTLTAASSAMAVAIDNATLGGTPIGLVWDSTVTANDQFIVALTNGNIYRLSLSGSTWSRTQIGSGFTFNTSATQVLALSPDGATLLVAGTSRIYAFARCGVITATNNCNGDNEADVCDILLSGAGHQLPDCNGNGKPDSCDIAVNGGSTDCNNDQIPDECASCAVPVDMVFAVDTSGSMDDEAAIICTNINAIVTSLQAEGIVVHPTIYGIGATPGGVFSCLTSTVGNALGTSVPGNPGPSSNGANQNTLYSGCTTTGGQEDWGRASNVIAGRFGWENNAIRLVVNVSDEGPWCGSGLDAADTDSITYSIATANGAAGPGDDVIVSTIIASGYSNSSNVPMEQRAVELANGTGGTVTRELSGPDLVDAMKRVVRNACIDQNDCNDDLIPDACQLAGNDCNNDGRLDICDGTICNTPPEVSDATLYNATQATGPNATVYNVTTGFNDPPDFGPVGTISVQSATGGTTTIDQVAHTITFTPTSPSAASTYTVNFTACDTGNPARCDTGVLTIIYNDPPVLKTVSLGTIAFSDVVSTPYASLFTSTGTVLANSNADGDADGILSTNVAAAAGGGWSLGPQALTGGSTCTAVTSPGNTDELPVSFTAGTTVGSSTCYVRVCEELPASDTRVCSVTTITANIVQCINNDDCPGGLCNTNTNQCQGNPDAINDTLNASASSPLNFNRSNLTSNDTSVDPTSLTVTVQPSSGTLTGPDGSGNMTYTAAVSNPPASTTFTYRVCATPPNQAVCDTAVVTININRAPAASNQTQWAAVGDVNATFNPTTGYTDPENNAIATLTFNGAVAGGSVSYTNGNIVFVPASPSTPATYTINYTVCDNGTPSACDPATTLTVIYNDPPVLVAQSDIYSYGDTGSFNFSSIFSGTGTINGDDTSAADNEVPDDSVRSIQVGTTFAGPFGDSATLNGTTLSVATPGLDNSNLSATASSTAANNVFYVRVCEEMPPTSTAVCSVATVTLRVVQCEVHADCSPTQRCDTNTFTCVATAVANEDQLAASATSPLSFNRSALVANDTDYQLSSFALISATTTQGGTLTYDSNTGAMTYTTPAAVITSDSFNYRVCTPVDPTACSTATVFITVNRKPDQANATQWASVGDVSSSYNPANNFTDPDGHTVGTVTINGVVGSGNASYTAGNIVFVPSNPAAAGSYTVNYTTCDSGVPTACDAGVLTVTYNDPPVLLPQTDMLAFGDTSTINFTSFFSSVGSVNGDDTLDVESPDDAVRSTLVGTAFAGPFGNSSTLSGTTVALQTVGLDNSNLAITAGSTTGTFTFYVQVCEEMPAASTKVCTVTTLNVTIVQCENNQDCTAQQRCDLSNNTCVPIADAVNDTLAASATSPLAFNRSNLLANDTNYQASTFTLNSLTTTNGGTLTYNSQTGQMTYTAPNAVITSDSFTYNVCTPVDVTACDTATVNITVNRAPVVSNATVWAAVGDANSSFQPSTVFTDADGHTLATVTIGNVVGGTASFTAGSIVFSPSTPSAAGTYTVAYTACDSGSPTACDNTNTLTIIYNDPPVLTPQATTLAWSDSVTVPFSSIFVGPGTIAGDDPADGDTDAIRTTRVGTSVNGPFSTNANLSGTSATLVNAGLDTSDLSFVAGTTSGTLTFYVQVCEERPGASTAVCTVTTVTVTSTECLDNTDCDGTFVCQIGATVLENTCVPCLNTVGGAGQDAGCNVGEPICNEVLNPNDCVTCINDSNPSGPVPDTGCSAALPACDDRGGTTTTCVECLQDADCFAGEVCDEPNRTCVPCVDNLPVSSLPTPDDGCTTGSPLCELSSGPADPTECVVCQQTAPTNDIDPGCSQGAPDCEINAQTGVRRCLGCLSDQDCPEGQICNDGACVACVDTAVFPTLDRGCSATEEICLLQPPSALPEPTGLVGVGCVLCRDDHGPALIDTGCTSQTPVCDALRQTGEVCVECLGDPDCAPRGLVCDETINTCVPCVDSAPLTGQDDGCPIVAKPICDDRGNTGTETCEECLDTVPVGLDLGCTIQTPACWEAAPGGHDCVECTKNDDCALGKTCQLSTHTCVACVDDAAFPNVDSGCSPGDPVCAEQGSISGGGGGTIRNCVVCEDDKLLDTQTDEGCTASTPICDDSVPGGKCVECNDAADCGPGETCDTDNGICVICLDDRLPGTVDTGCNATNPVCELGNPGMQDDHCVECEDDKGPGLVDWGCDQTERYCDERAAGGPNCHECETDEDCPGTQVCDPTGKCVDPGTTQANDDQYTTTEGQPLNVSSAAAGVAGNDTVPPGSTYTVALVQGTGPNPTTQGTLVLNSNGTFTFTPVQGFGGVVTFTYTLTATLNGATDTAVVTITVNGKPRAQNDSVTTAEDTAIDFDPRANDTDPNGDSMTISRITSQPTHGTVTFTGTSVHYVPARDYTGPDSLVYEVCDTTSLCATATVNINVTPVNDPPLAGDDLVDTPEDIGVLVVVLANDFDSDSPTLDVRRITSAPTHGTAVIQPDDSVLYTPSGNFNGDDAFTYEVCDSAGQCDEAVVLVTVKPVNDAPVAGDDQTTTPRSTAVTLPVLANDSDVDGDELTVSRLVTTPASGNARVDASGTITYTPASGTTGAVTFSYEVCDNAGLCDIANVVVTVGVDNDPPVVRDDSASTPMDEPVTIHVLDNDSDPDGGTVTLQQTGQPSSGSVSSSPAGVVTYVPADGFVGTVTFTYTACDEEGACATATVTVDVSSIGNRPPIATDDTVSTRTNTPVNLDPTDNDVDPDGDALAVSDITLDPAHGTATLEDDGSITYIPANGFVGNDTFEVLIDDGRGGTDTSVVTVVVRPDANVDPVARDDAYDVPADEPSELDVLVNDSDPNGDTITIVDVVQGEQGTVTIIVENNKVTLVYTPNEGATGTDTFTYTISDGRGGEDVATVTLTFPDEPIDNRKPEVTGENVKTPEDTGILIIVLENDVDPDGDPLTVTAITVPPRHGTVTIDAGGGVLYVPDADYVGPDVFDYRVCDAAGLCDDGVVAVTVTPVNDPPRANDDSYSVPEDETATLEVTLNDSDPELDELTVTRIVSQATKGTAYVNPDGTVTFEPNGQTGRDSFVYEVCDVGGLCDTAKVTLNIGGSNRNPVPEDDEAQTNAGESVDVDVLANDRDPDGDDLTVTQVEDPAHGTAIIDGGVVVYTPDLDFIGTEIFFYTVCDEDNACSTAFVIVEVTPGANTPPTAVDDTVDTPESTPVTIDTTDNDVDFDGDPISVTSVTQPDHGTVKVNDDGTVTYTPEDGYVGDDTFTVTITDGNGGSSTQNVLVHVTPANNRPPNAVDDSYDAPSDVATDLPVLVNDSDPDGDPMTITDVVQPQHGVVSINADGTLRLQPDPAYIGPDRFSYTITDGRGGYDTAFVDLVIGDRDHDGLGDGWEVTETGTDPDDFDSDDDGVGDGEEVGGGDEPLVYEPGVDTNPLDNDTDDDGIKDGDEIRGEGPLDEPTDPLNPDTDDDGVGDGVEVGVTEPVPGGTTDGPNPVPFEGTDTDVWHPDVDPGTTTDPNDDDSDDDGLTDGNEDKNGNGGKDGQIGDTGTPGTGETDPTNPDTDGDGIQDGTELGLTEPQGTGTDISKFQPDLDPTTTTDPRDTDTDDGGVDDGDEDINFNGYQDPTEIDPNYGVDDSGPQEIGFLAEGGGCAGGAEGLMFGLVGLGLVMANRRRRA